MKSTGQTVVAPDPTSERLSGDGLATGYNHKTVTAVDRHVCRPEFEVCRKQARVKVLADAAALTEQMRPLKEISS